MDDAGVLGSEREGIGLERERDEELALAAGSDPAAFGLLYDRHRLAVFRYLRSRTRTEDDAAELTAVSFERALAAIHRYRPAGGGFPAWLLRIARNAAIDAARRGRPAAALPVDVRDDRSSVTPEAAVLAVETRRALREAVDRLPDLQREAIALRYAARLTAREIGEVIGRSETATQKLLSRALAAIRETYRDDD